MNDSCDHRSEGENPAIEVSAATVSITPPQLGIELAGYIRKSGAKAIHDPIEANGILFREHSGRTAIVLTLDTLYVGADLTNRLQRHLQERFGVAETDFLIFASHTHFAPALDRSKLILGKVDDGYFDWVATRCEALVAELFQRRMLKPSIKSLRSNWFGAVYRRKPWPLPYLVSRKKLVFREPAMAPNPGGPTDPVVRLWEVGLGLDRIALIWSCACHPTEHVNQYDVSADYCGFVRHALRQAVGWPIPVLFLQGFAGDLRPLPPRRRRSLRSIVNILLFGPTFGPFTADSYAKWCEALARVAQDMLGNQAGRTEPLAGQIASTKTDTALSDLITGCSVGARRITFQRLKIGNLFDVIGVPAEPSNQLRHLIPHRDVVPIGYLGDAFGYWPTEAQRQEGGYEAKTFLRAFGFAGGRLVADLDQKFIDCLPGFDGERHARG